ncbi:MAG: outer membrane beta-barrel protein [Chitinophagaceae bacterium]
MKKELLVLCCSLAAGHLHAQDSLKLKNLWLSGYADVYYKYNFNGNASDNETSFTNSQNSFELDMLSVKLQHTFGNVSFTGELGFGKRAEEFSYNDKGLSAAIQQLYLTYTILPWLKVTAGSFDTYMGYESASADSNRNYSTSYIFTYEPFFHTGLRADFTAGSNTFMLGVFNPPDFKYAPLNSKKYIGAQWGFVPKEIPFTSYLNYMGGTDTSGTRNDLLDLVLNYHFNKWFSIVYDGSYSHYGKGISSAHWWGSALYFNKDLNDKTGLTLRVEFFNDRDNLKAFTDKEKFPEGGYIWSFTLSGNYKIKALTLIPEVRLDQASAPLFTKNGVNTDYSPNVLVAAVYSF